MEDREGMTENKLKEMQRYYPEDYFKRSGYPMAPLSETPAQGNKKGSNKIAFKRVGSTKKL